jgi:hypothetical protein
MFPMAQLAIDVTAQECSVCTRLVIVATSPQIASAITMGRSPCTQRDQAGGPTGCMLETVFAASIADCGGTSCGPYMVDLSQEFFPVSTGAAPSITDTVSFCPYNYDGQSFTPAGECVASSTGQCDLSANLTMIINGIASPATDAGAE